MVSGDKAKFNPIVDVTGKRAAEAYKKYTPELDSNGFVSPYEKQIPSGYKFDEDRDYLLPINTRDIKLSNGKLKQNPGYK